MMTELKKAETQKEILEAIDNLTEPIPSSEMIVMDSLPDLMEKFEEEKVMEELNKNLNERFEPRNRAERRAWEKELKKKNKKKRVFADSIRQAAERLAYTEMIQRVRKMNEELEKEGAKENEAAN